MPVDSMPMRLHGGRPLRKASNAVRWFASLRTGKLPSEQATTISSLATSAPVLSTWVGICMMYLPWLRLRMLGWTHLRELAVKSAVKAARFLIDAGGVGGGILLEFVSR